jgi:hypothetical protein
MDGQQPAETPTPTQFAPGDTISPQQQTPNSPSSPAVNTKEPPQAAPLPQLPTEEPNTELPEPAEVQQPQQPTSTLQQPTFSQSVSVPDNAHPADQTDDVISWTASEFIAHHKSSGWYALLLLASAVAAILIWLGTKDVVSAIVVVFAATMLATFAARKPRQLSYQLDPAGLTIGEKFYGFNEFRAFSIVPEGAFSSIVFTPHKRFGTLVTIYYDPEDEERIIDAISQRLPHQEHRADLVDGMMRRIRF